MWTELVDGIPSITFSDRAKDFIERKMAKIIIIQLLGIKIAFDALLNRVTMLGKTKCPFQLMDLENDYYLACFNDEEDYYKVLTNGPWVIFGQYLTVRPWSPDFLMVQDEVWALWSWGRFPASMKETSVKMPMSKIQVPQDLQKRIEEEDYESWMIIECQQQRKGRSLGGKSSDNQDSLGGGSSFDVLGENQGLIEVEEANMVRELSIEKGTIKGTSNGRNPKVAVAYTRNGSKVKGKGILVAFRPKVGVNMLKPVNKGIERGPINFNDGAIMGRKAGDVNTSPFRFQTIQVLSGLDSNRTGL
ncbi:hypothetical protein GOBAR_DD18754 [Gossypium barbadense]|nr:hypothetical protein GOBAR_DD18754 [Gossypium barbadense]